MQLRPLFAGMTTGILLGSIVASPSIAQEIDCSHTQLVYEDVVNVVTSLDDFVRQNQEFAYNNPHLAFEVARGYNFVANGLQYLYICTGDRGFVQHRDVITSKSENFLEYALLHQESSHQEGSTPDPLDIREDDSPELIDLKIQIRNMGSEVTQDILNNRW